MSQELCHVLTSLPSWEKTDINNYNNCNCPKCCEKNLYVLFEFIIVIDIVMVFREAFSEEISSRPRAEE